MKLRCKTINMRAVFCCCVLTLCGGISATAQTWMGTVDNQWVTDGNWDTGVAPATYPTVNFTNDGNGQRTIRFGTAYVRYLNFKTAACGAYTFDLANGRRLWLTQTNPTVTIDQDVTQNQTVKARIRLGNKDAETIVKFRNYSSTAKFIAQGYLEPQSLATTMVNFEGIGDMDFLDGCTNTVGTTTRYRNYSDGTITLGGLHHINQYYIYSVASGRDPHLVLQSGAELFLDYKDANWTIWQQAGISLIEGAGTLRLGVGDNGEPAKVHLHPDAEMTIKAPLTSAGGLDLVDYFGTLGNGTLILDCVNTMASNLVVSSGGRVSVAKIGNQGATDSNLGLGSRVELKGDGSTLRYTGEGETTDRIIEFSNNAVLDQSGSGDLIFSEDLIVAAEDATLTLQGTGSGVGILAGSIGTSASTTTLIKAGDGVWQLCTTNFYTGGTVVQGGTLQPMVNDALPPGGGVEMAGGTLEMGAVTNSCSSLYVTADSAIALGSGQLSFTTQNNLLWSGTLTLTGELSDYAIRTQPKLTTQQIALIAYEDLGVYQTSEGYLRPVLPGTQLLLR